MGMGKVLSAADAEEAAEIAKLKAEEEERARREAENVVLKKAEKEEARNELACN